VREREREREIYIYIYIYIYSSVKYRKFIPITVRDHNAAGERRGGEG